MTDTEEEAVQNELRELKVQRKILRGKFTRFVTFINNDLNKENFTEISIRLKKVESALEEFETIQNKIDVLIEPEEPGIELGEFEDTFFATISKARELLNAQVLNTPNPAPTTQQSTIPTEVTQTHIQINDTFTVRLPKLDLPTFNGVYHQWLNFYDSFKSLIHDNKQLINVQKLHYLRSCLKDEAAKVVSSLETSAANYDVAWDLLIERYDNNRIIVQNHIKTLMELPSFSKESAANIRNLVDNFQMHLRALKALNEPVDKWDSVLIYVLTSKLDRATHREWEKGLTGKTMPKFDALVTFLRNKYQILEASTFDNKVQSTSQVNNSTKKQTLSVIQSKDFCNFCKGEHKIYVCTKFQELSTTERSNAVKTLGICFNCLRRGHRSSECTLSKCKKCNKKHHTLLHSEEYKKNDNATPTQACFAKMHSQVLLSTAIVYIHDKNDTPIKARVVLDSGSQSNFMTERLAKLLELDREKVNIPVEGLNQVETKIKHSVLTQLKSKHTDFAVTLNFLVIPQICNALPLEFIDRKQIEIPKNINLADPEFHKPADIDILLGAEIFYDLISVGQIRLTNQNALLQKTKLGWVLAGKIGQVSETQRSKCHLSLDKIHKQITRFWEIEEPPIQKCLSPEENQVECHFSKNVQRDSEGRFIVRLPFNGKIEKLGNSYKIAEHRLLSLEKKFKSNDCLKMEYFKFMREYENLGHMTKVAKDKINYDGYFLPHHAVIKENSNTTKVRVVFDGSAKSNTGISLNETLKVGPTIQQSLVEIILRSRTHQIIISADIEKMYRMVKVHEDDKKFQRIIWREDSNKELEIYELNTVTYGLASAPYLATRTLRELADREKEKFPRAAEIVKRDFYVDDLITGCNNLKEAKSLLEDLNNLLKLGGFNLRQWSSNNLNLISSLPEDLKNVKLFSDPSLSIKTLGIHWNPRNDTIVYSVENKFNKSRITKRNMLSQIAQLFDPIGLLGPVIIKAKILMQKLWQIKCDWDETVPPEIHTAWFNYNSELQFLNDVTFNRLVVINQAVKIQIHGFCDASEAAYGACLYIRSQNAQNEVSVNLLCSKTRVAPLKSITIPRLELCAALLLANLLQSVRKILNLDISNVFLWSDSTITLQWINTQPHLLKTFIANRVSQIQELTSISEWRHVFTNHNPADFISRGQSPREFIQNAMWTNGPEWLQENESHWPNHEFEKRASSELKPNVNLFANSDKTSADTLNRLLVKFSSLNKIKRVMAFCMKFITNLKSKLQSKDKKENSLVDVNDKNVFKGIYLSVKELQVSMKRILILVQRQDFKREIIILTNTSELPRSSPLISLTPFLDKDGLLRVGGRIKNSILPYNQTHPILLPKAHHITNLIIETEHLNNHHSGAHATLNSVRANYWPINGLSIVNKFVRNCIKCIRAKPTNQDYLMGNLPKDRVTESRPFTKTGVDYCGPFYIKEKKHRNRNKVKSYVSIFVCFATKACHLELVSDMSTEAFIGCLKRFLARRGKSSTIYSDNGTNFVGANNELSKTLKELLNSETHNSEVSAFLKQKEIEWKFSPPNSPHFGGLWEAAVKSFKNLFFKSLGDRLLTFEELSTCVTEIEAILNSRPITPLSSDPNDLRSLSPSYFLIGDSLMSVPEHDLSEVAENRLSCWQNVQRVKQYFWKRWYKEYLNQLNIRNKWQRSAKNPEIGTMVIVRDDNLPPLRWQLGRVIDIHPGDDSIVRVVTVRTKNGTYKRSVKRIVTLPIE